MSPIWGDVAERGGKQRNAAWDSYTNALIAQGYAMGRSGSEVEKRLKVDDAVVVYKLVGTLGPSGIKEPTNPNEFVIFTLDELYTYARRVMANVTVDADGGSITVTWQQAVDDSDNTELATLMFERFCMKKPGGKCNG